MMDCPRFLLWTLHDFSRWECHDWGYIDIRVCKGCGKQEQRMCSFTHQRSRWHDENVKWNR